MIISVERRCTTIQNLLLQLNEEEPELIRTRNNLHRCPELSGKETKTLAFLRKRLSEWSIPFTEVENGGIIASLHAKKASGKPQKTILLRADMDALPVEESSENLKQKKEVVSQRKGIAHVCGHDAHTAMLLTAAKILCRRKEELDGSVFFCFERAEEGGGPGHAFGVDPLLSYMKQKGLCPDHCLALHVTPELDTGKISAEPGGVMAGSFGFEIHIKGKGGHGSRPDLANNPLDCFAAFYQAINSIRLRQISPHHLLTFSIPLVRMGSLGNVIEEELYFEGTARSLDYESLVHFRDTFLKQLKHMTAAFDCSYQIDVMYIESPLCNHPKVAESVREVVTGLFGREQYQACKPNLSSESFAQYTELFPGAMAFLGIRNTAYGSGAPLHASNFDLDVHALRYGAGLLAGYALREVKNETITTL